MRQTTIACARAFATRYTANVGKLSPDLDRRLDQISERALRGDIASAVHELRGVLEQQPDSPDAWLTLAVIFSSAARWAEAHDAFRRATQLGTHAAAAWAGWGRVLAQMGRLDEACDAYRRAHELAPANASPLRDIAALRYRQERYDDALAELALARTIAPRDVRIAYAIGSCEEARREPAAAIAAYRDAVRLDSKFGPAYKSLADVLAALGEHEQAIAVLDALLRIERANEQAAHNREVLQRALLEMRARRLLGQDEHAWQISATVQEGALVREPDAHHEAAHTGVLRYANAWAELYLWVDASKRVHRAALALRDVERAAKKRDDAFLVTVVNERGELAKANYPTAISLTFLRESLGVPLTFASSAYRSALSGDAATVAAAQVAFTTVPDTDGAGGSLVNALTVWLPPG